MADFDDYAWLVSDAAALLLLSMEHDRRTELQQLGELRKSLSAERARLVVEQVDLRRRAVSKFGAAAARMFFTKTQLEQATDGGIAAYKAERLRGAGGGRLIHDYCCGIGGDLMALAARGPAIGWELSPIVRLFAEKNLAAAAELGNFPASNGSVRDGDVTELTPAADELWHVDPDRRTDGRRSTTLEHHTPGPEVIERWRTAAPDGAVKLSPASEPPEAWQREGELEWITSQRECRQLVVWFGTLATAPGQRRATSLHVAHAADQSARGAVSAATFCGAADEPCAAADEPRRFLYDPDPSLIAAHLVGAIANRYELKSLGAGGTYLTGDRDADDPLLAKFEIVESLPLRAALVAAALAKRGVGRVEVKKRGVTVEPEKFRRSLKLRGEGEATVILTRVGKRELALIAERR